MAGPEGIGPKNAGDPICALPSLPPPEVLWEKEGICADVGLPVDASDIHKPGGAAPAVNLSLEPRPAPLWMLGRPGYYRWRVEEFRQRHPGQKPPDYYLFYGEKYAERFSRETGPKLSPDGQKWLEKARYLLQKAIEDRIALDPAGFERMERDSKAFRAFAYQTHAKAYLDAGLADLSIDDWMQIGRTPDLLDMLSEEAVIQVVDVAEGVVDCKLEPFREVGRAAAEAGEIVSMGVEAGEALYDAGKAILDLFE